MRIFLDIEVYPNWFVCNAESEVGKRVTYYLYDSAPIRKMLLNHTTVGFNSLNYDLPILWAIASRQLTTHEDVYALSGRIVEDELRGWQLRDLYGVPGLDHVDLMEPAPGVGVSLKLYGGRLGAQRLQDLPLPPDTVTTFEQQRLLTEYCWNDVTTTRLLYEAIKPRIDLRDQISEMIGVDVRSKSDAQIAEAILRSELPRFNKPRLDQRVAWIYEPPAWLAFKSEQLRGVMALIGQTRFRLSDKTAVNLPAHLTKLVLRIGTTDYKLGIGGLHSQEQKQGLVSDDRMMLMDWDVASYYPSIIRTLNLYPSHLGLDFLRVYSRVIDDRLKAKREGDKVVADSYKIVLNGSFGKFGSQYSPLFSPKLLTQVTLTGQLALLMLIERLEDQGIAVRSANTDGIVIYCRRDREHDAKAIISDWEKETGFQMERSDYVALYSRDVNNYVAVKEPDVKGKGIFAAPGLMKNPQNPVIAHSVVEFLSKGTPIEQTIEGCEDLLQFLTVRTVRGGGLWRGREVGKVVRWYRACGGDTITYATNGNKVPSSGSAVVVQDLIEFPDDVDYDWYVSQAHTLLDAVGYGQEADW